MKILLAVHHFPPQYNGGAEWEAFHIADSLLSRGHSVKVVCIESIDQGPTDGVAWTDEIYDGIPVRRLSYNRAAKPIVDRAEYDNPWIGQHFDRLFDEFKPDIFHLLSGYLMTARPIWEAYAHKIPSVISLEDFWFLCRRITMFRTDKTLNTLPIDPFACARCLSGENRPYNVLNRIAPGLMKGFWHLQNSTAQAIDERLNFLVNTLHKADRLIMRSNFLRSTYISAGAPAEKMVFSRQGLDFPAPLSKSKKSPDRPLQIGYIGQVAWHKGVHVLLEAARRLPQANLEVKIFGNLERFPDYADQLRKIIADDTRLSLMGTYKGYAEESLVLRDLDVVVVPSVWYENSPNAILESFSQKVPVIASNLGGMAELVQHDKNGLVFEVGNAEDLARQLQRCCDEPDLLPRLQMGITPVKSISEEIDELEQIYQDLLAHEESILHDAETTVH